MIFSWLLLFCLSNGLLAFSSETQHESREEMASLLAQTSSSKSQSKTSAAVSGIPILDIFAGGADTDKSSSNVAHRTHKKQVEKENEISNKISGVSGGNAKDRIDSDKLSSLQSKHPHHQHDRMRGGVSSNVNAAVSTTTMMVRRRMACEGCQRFSRDLLAHAVRLDLSADAVVRKGQAICERMGLGAEPANIPCSVYGKMAGFLARGGLLRANKNHDDEVDVVKSATVKSFCDYAMQCNTVSGMRPSSSAAKAAASLSSSTQNGHEGAKNRAKTSSSSLSSPSPEMSRLSSQGNGKDVQGGAEFHNHVASSSSSSPPEIHVVAAAQRQSPTATTTATTSARTVKKPRKEKEKGEKGSKSIESQHQQEEEEKSHHRLNEKHFKTLGSTPSSPPPPPPPPPPPSSAAATAARAGAQAKAKGKEVRTATTATARTSPLNHLKEEKDKLSSYAATGADSAPVANDHHSAVADSSMANKEIYVRLRVSDEGGGLSSGRQRIGSPSFAISSLRLSEQLGQTLGVPSNRLEMISARPATRVVDFVIKNPPRSSSLKGSGSTSKTPIMLARRLFQIVSLQREREERRRRGIRVDDNAKKIECLDYSFGVQLNPTRFPVASSGAEQLPKQQHCNVLKTQLVEHCGNGTLAGRQQGLPSFRCTEQCAGTFATYYTGCLDPAVSDGGAGEEGLLSGGVGRNISIADIALQDSEGALQYSQIQNLWLRFSDFFLSCRHCGVERRHQVIQTCGIKDTDTRYPGTCSNQCARSFVPFYHQCLQHQMEYLPEILRTAADSFHTRCLRCSEDKMPEIMEICEVDGFGGFAQCSSKCADALLPYIDVCKLEHRKTPGISSFVKRCHKAILAREEQKKAIEEQLTTKQRDIAQQQQKQQLEVLQARKAAQADRSVSVTLRLRRSFSGVQKALVRFRKTFRRELAAVLDIPSRRVHIAKVGGNTSHVDVSITLLKVPPGSYEEQPALKVLQKLAADIENDQSELYTALSFGSAIDREFGLLRNGSPMDIEDDKSESEPQLKEEEGGGEMNQLNVVNTTKSSDEVGSYSKAASAHMHHHHHHQQQHKNQQERGSVLARATTTRAAKNSSVSSSRHARNQKQKQPERQPPPPPPAPPLQLHAAALKRTVPEVKAEPPTNRKISPHPPRAAVESDAARRRRPAISPASVVVSNTNGNTRKPKIKTERVSLVHEKDRDRAGQEAIKKAAARADERNKRLLAQWDGPPNFRQVNFMQNSRDSKGMIERKAGDKQTTYEVRAVADYKDRDNTVTNDGTVDDVFQGAYEEGAQQHRFASVYYN